MKNSIDGGSFINKVNSFPDSEFIFGVNQHPGSGNLMLVTFLFWPLVNDSYRSDLHGAMSSLVCSECAQLLCVHYGMMFRALLAASHSGPFTRAPSPQRNFFQTVFQAQRTPGHIHIVNHVTKFTYVFHLAAERLGTKWRTTLAQAWFYNTCLVCDLPLASSLFPFPHFLLFLFSCAHLGM